MNNWILTFSCNVFIVSMKNAFSTFFIYGINVFSILAMAPKNALHCYEMAQRTAPARWHTCRWRHRRDQMASCCLSTTMQHFLYNNDKMMTDNRVAVGNKQRWANQDSNRFTGPNRIETRRILIHLTLFWIWITVNSPALNWPRTISNS